MGIPYSKEINKAFDELNKAYGQVTPLVAAAYDVLETTKNISLLLAGIQVLTVILLGFILLALVGLLITMNPELEEERVQFVTPVVKWVAGWADIGKVGVGSAMAFGLLIAGASGVVVFTTRKGQKERRDGLGLDGEQGGDGDDEGEGEDGEKEEKK
ncbi:hypothetical protein MMC10_010087 [Thelotrema lepadinum]|nr:hypothetical protein [Thelotrema lepadinum]